MTFFDKRTVITIFVVFTIALSVRFAHLESIKNNPFFNNPIMDEKYHDEWAQEIAQGDLFARAPFYRAPAYPFLLGAIYTVIGHGYYAPRLIGILIGALSVVIIYLIGSVIYSHRIGLLAALLAGFYGTVSYTHLTLPTTPYV
jgi:predicted membrane-bound mannosyltransferase